MRRCSARLAVVTGVLLLALSASSFADEIRGRVLIEGRPAGGVEVAVVPFEDGFARARREARREGEPRPLATATTTREGLFALSVPPASSAAAMRLHLSGDATPPVVLTRLLDGADEDVGDVHLGRAAAVAGRVLDPRGGPVVGATVTLFAGEARRFDDERSPAEAVPQTVTTKADGAFVFESAAAEGNRIRVETPPFALAERAGVRAGALARALALELGVVVRGTVTLPDGKTPAAGALVRFEGRARTRFVEARRDGTFLIEGAPPESGSVVADGGDRGRGSVPVAPERSEPLVVTLAPTAGLAGRVVDASSGAPLEGVRLLVKGDGAAGFLARSGRDGAFGFAALPPGPCTLEAEDERFVEWVRALALTAGQVERQDVPLLRAASVAGRIVDERSAPIAGARVVVAPAVEERFSAFVRRMEGRASAARSLGDGSFRATRVRPGEVRLDISHDEYENRSVAGIEVTPGASRSGVRVVLRRGLTVRGIVRDEEERPLAGVDVRLGRSFRFRGGRRGGGMTMIGPPTQVRRETGPDGRFEFRGLEAGEYSLWARRPGFAHENRDSLKVDEGEPAEPIEVVLKPGATLSGFVRDRSGNGAAGWLVTARSAAEGSGPVFGPGSIGTEQPTEGDGSFLIEGVLAGAAYLLQALGPSGLGPRLSDVTAPAADLELTVGGSGQVRGQVVDAESGRGVTDFEVRYQPDATGGMMRFAFRGGQGRGPYEPRSFHAEDGAFVLDDVPAGRWTVEVRAEGYQNGSASGVVVEEGGVVEGVDVRLSRGHVLSGQVVEARTGRPLLDATVQAELSGGGGRGGRPRFGGDREDFSASTDAEGRFEITGLAPGTWSVTASHPDWSEATASVEVSDSPASVDLRLETGAAVSGVVLAGGRGVEGAQVGIEASGETGLRGVGGGQTALTDPSGRFRFDRLSPGRYELVATLRSQTSAPVEAVVTAEAPREVSLTLAEGATIHGTVSGLSDAEKGRVDVSASGPDDYFASTRAGAEGTFELTGVPEGVLTLSANAGDFVSGSRSARATVTIGSGQAEAFAEIVFAPGFRVEGRVSRGGQPLPDTLVFAAPEGGGGPGASAQTDASGLYSLDGLEEGTHTFVAAVTSGSPIRRTVTLTGDTTVDLEAPTARLVGIVVDSGTGRPLGDVAVRLEGAEGAGPRFMNGASSDSSGRFAFEDLEPRTYRLSFQKPAYEAETREMPATEDGREIRVELRRGEGLALEARDGIYGTPLRGVFVRALDAGGAAVFAGSVPLDSTGRGEVPSLKPGSYELRVDSSGYAPVVRPGVLVPSTGLVLALTPGGSLEIRVGPETLARPQPRAFLYGPDGQPYSASIFSTDGAIPLGGAVRRLDNVAPGRYVLAVEGGARSDVEVREGGASVVRLP